MNSTTKLAFKKRIVICGSMSFYSDMLEVMRLLKGSGINSVMPEADDNLMHTLKEVDFQAMKRRVSMRHIRRIRDQKTLGILVVNCDKHGFNDYIGANTFAEIAIAISHYKRVYLYQGIPEFYRDELKAWQVISLDGSLANLVEDFKKAALLEAAQLKLFDF
jgi:hypothetical protein